MKKVFALLLILALLTGCSPIAPPASAPTGSSTTIGEGLEIHFIDVGQADCALLECDDEFILIDGGNVEDSSLVVSYLEQQGVEELEAVICTHAHEDHVGGLPGVLAVYPTAAVYAPTNTYSSECFDEFVYYTDQQRLEITIPQPGDVITFGSATAKVMGPVKSYADPNETSIVLMVSFGSHRFLFTGDMEVTAENDMLDYWGENYDWHADVLKVGHHGSETSTGYRFLNAIMPTYGIISVGQGNSYGHPHEQPLSRLHAAGVMLFRTDKLGHITVLSDGTNLHLQWGNQNANPEGGEPADETFIGNKNSKTFHLPTCGNLPKAENRVEFDSYDDAIAAGYKPCGNCLK